MESDGCIRGRQECLPHRGHDCPTAPYGQNIFTSDRKSSTAATKATGADARIASDQKVLAGRGRGRRCAPAAAAERFFRRGLPLDNRRRQRALFLHTPRPDDRRRGDRSRHGSRRRSGRGNRARPGRIGGQERFEPLPHRPRAARSAVPGSFAIMSAMTSTNSTLNSGFSRRGSSGRNSQ